MLFKLKLPRVDVAMAIAGLILLALVQIAAATPIPAQANNHNVLVAHQPHAVHEIDITAKRINIANSQNMPNDSEHRALDQHDHHNDSDAHQLYARSGSPETSTNIMSPNEKAEMLAAAHALCAMKHSSTKPSTSFNNNPGKSQTSNSISPHQFAEELKIQQEKQPTLNMFWEKLRPISDRVKNNIITNTKVPYPEAVDLQRQLMDAWHNVIIFMASYMTPYGYYHNLTDSLGKYTFQQNVHCQRDTMCTILVAKPHEPGQREVLEKLKEVAKQYLEDYNKIIDKYEKIHV
ncbi:hypothetical protein H0H93_008258 [Arthromyces matolae]|nr:hypothetical protein H0H93_008258 [Arthromyces matolae]